MPRDLSYRSPPSLSVVENATSPIGDLGSVIWSTASNKLLVWDGSKWVSLSGSSSGSGDVTGPSSSTDASLVVFNGNTGKQIVEASHFDNNFSTNVSAPPVNKLRWFSRNIASRGLPGFIDSSNIDTLLQPALFDKNTYMWLPGTGTTLAINWGTSWVARNSGTGAAQSHPARTTTNALTTTVRATFSTGTTATGTSGIQSGTPVAWRGNVANLGGFFFYARFGVETLASGIQLLIGLSALNAVLAGEPSAQNDTIALGKDSTDTSWQIISRNATAVTKTNTGCVVTQGQILDFYMFAAPNSNSVTCTLLDPVTNVVYLDNINVTSNLPTNTTFLYAQARIRSTAGTTAKLLALNRMYIETDIS